MDKYTYFWTIIIIGMAIFFIGVYKNVVEKVCYILWVNQREDEKTGKRKNNLTISALIKTVVRESLIQWRISDRSRILWTRHFLIFAGFMLLFLLDGFYAMTTQYYPLAYFQSGPGRGVLKLGLEFTGFLLFIGLTIGVIHRLVFNKDEKSYIDLKMLLLLWAVVTTGFLTESLRFVLEPDDPFRHVSFVASPLAHFIGNAVLPWERIYIATWILHATITVGFFACIPFSKFVHVLVSPIGRSITLENGYVSGKRQQVTENLL